MRIMFIIISGEATKCHGIEIAENTCHIRFIRKDSHVFILRKII